MIESNRNVVVFDLEATGLKTTHDRIIQIGAVKVTPEGRVLSHLEMLINPECEVSGYVLDMTGLDPWEIAQAPTWREVAAEVRAYMSGCDLAGYNVLKYDVPLMAEEFARIGEDFPEAGTRVFDAQVVYHRYHRRDLSAAVMEYVGRRHDRAHDAMGDVLATLEVLQGQMKKHQDLPRDADTLADWCARGKRPADWGRMFYWDQAGRLHYDFGRYKDRAVEEDWDTLAYARWMILQPSFPRSTTRFLAGYFMRDVAPEGVL